MPAKKAAKKPASAKARIDGIDFEAILSPAGLAQELAKSAAALAEAMETGKFCQPLERNLATWTAVRTLANRQNGSLDPALKQELTEMAELVTTATLAAARSGTPQAIEPLIAMDLSLSKLLSDATLEQMTRDRAYYLWQEAGCPHGNDQEYWFTAANEIQGLRASLR